MKQVLLVEDDDSIAELVAAALARERLRVERLRDAESALVALRRFEPDAILLDLGLPGLDGLEFCRIVRRTRRTPILILTSRREELDKVLGLELGADDYVTKPFGVRELVARVKALLRRAEPPADDVRRFGSLTIDASAKLASRAGRPLDLTAMEYRLLELLSAAPGRVFSRDEILDRLGEAAQSAPSTATWRACGASSRTSARRASWRRCAVWATASCAAAANRRRRPGPATRPAARRHVQGASQTGGEASRPTTRSASSGRENR